MRLPEKSRVDGPGDQKRAERQRDEVRLRPAFVIIRDGVALAENTLREGRVLEPVPAARVAARVDDAGVLGKFPVPVDAGREDLAADAHGCFVGGYMLWCYGVATTAFERQPASRAHGAADGSVASALGPQLARARHSAAGPGNALLVSYMPLVNDKMRACHR